MAILGTGGELNALTAVVDDEGVDLSLKRRNGSRTLDLQVKARFVDAEGSKALHERGTFVADVREVAFRPREDLFMLFVAVDADRADIDLAWLVPSLEFGEGAIRIKPKGVVQLRFQASAKEDSQDKWRGYRMTRDDLPAQLLKAVADLEAESS